MTDRKNAIAFKGNEFEYRISSTGSNEAPTRFPFVHLQHGRFAMYVRDGRHARKRVSQKPPADLRQQDGQRARISAGEISTCARHRRKPARADCRHGEFFRDFWQAVYGERKGDPRGQAERRDEEGGAGRRAGGDDGVHRRRSLGEVSVDRSRVGPGLRSPRWAGADTPAHVHARTCARAHAHARERTAASLMHRHRAAARCIALLHECAPCNRAHACPRDCVRARATRSRFRSVFARRGASPSVAASRPAKILARSVCSLASFPLPPRAARSSEGPASPLAPPLPLRLGSRSLFSVSVTHRQKVPLPRVPPPPCPSAVLPADDPALGVHRCYRGRRATSMRERERERERERGGRGRKGERWNLLTTVAN